MMGCTSMQRSLVFASVLLMAILGATSSAFAIGGKPRVFRHTSKTPRPPVLPLRYGDGTTSTKRTTKLKSAARGDAVNGKDEVTGWKAQLLKASDIASLLCVLDCTVLPVVTLVLPLFGFMATSPTQMEFLHELGHTVALFFVLPVGGSATLLNYMYAHRQERIAALGMVGLLLVLAANAPHSLLHALEHGILAPLEPLLHAVHHGIAHRLANLLGCACLLGSNYFSKQSGKCLHGHNHSECSDHTTKVSGHTHGHRHDHKHG